MKRIFKAVAKIPMPITAAVLLLLMGVILRICENTARLRAEREEQMQHEYYDISQLINYRAPTIDAQEEINRKNDEAYLNSLPDDYKNKPLLVEVYKKRYKRG